jgi:hypothetical protein
LAKLHILSWPCAVAWLQVYASHFALPDGTPYVQSNGKPRPGAPHLLGSTPEIEDLRPKSPPR